MICQQITSIILFIALFAGIRLILGMSSSLMIAHIANSCEILIAFLALERLLFSVSSKMDFEVTFLCKWLSTFWVLARKVSLGGWRMLVFLMNFKSIFTSKSLDAILTFILWRLFLPWVVKLLVKNHLTCLRSWRVE